MGYSGITSRSLNLKHISESSSPLENKLSYKNWKASKEAEGSDTSRKAYKAEKSAGRKAKREDMAYDDSNPYKSGRKLGNVLRDVIGKRVGDKNIVLASDLVNSFDPEEPGSADRINAGLAKLPKTTTGKLIQNVRNVAKQVFPDKDTRHGKLTGEVYGKDSEFAGAGIREGGTIQERQKKFTQKRADRINSRIRSDNPEGGSFVGNKLRQMKAAYAADPSKSVQSKNQTVENQNVDMNKGTLGNSLTKTPSIQTLRGNYNSTENLSKRIFKDPVIDIKFPETKSSNDFMKKYKKQK